MVTFADLCCVQHPSHIRAYIAAMESMAGSSKAQMLLLWTTITSKTKPKVTDIESLLTMIINDHNDQKCNVAANRGALRMHSPKPSAFTWTMLDLSSDSSPPLRFLSDSPNDAFVVKLFNPKLVKMLSELLINGSGRAHMLPVCPKHDLTLEHFDFTRLPRDARAQSSVIRVIHESQAGIVKLRS
jgi:hypothetical protein